MKFLKETAVVNAILIENRSLKFYRAMSAKVNDVRCRQILDLMAREEEEHLETICNMYPGNEDELYNALIGNNIYDDPYYRSLLKEVDGITHEHDVLRIALKEEQACIELYQTFVDTIREPEIHDIFVRIHKETSNHCEMISEEYMRLMNMADKTDQDIYVRE
jgi:rubrerythrin